MATSKKNAKTSKTAHVLNVITGGQEPAEPLGLEDADSAPQTAPVRQPEPAPIPILQMAPDSDDGLSQQILGALAEEVGMELPPPEPEPQAAHLPATPRQPVRPFVPPEPETVPVPEPPAPPAQAAPQAQKVQQFAPEEFEEEPEVQTYAPPQQPVLQKPQQRPPLQAAVPQSPAPVAPRHVEVAESEYVNVVQALVEEKAPKYLEMLGVCKCSRCVADVKALALSNLPPKYIVVPKSQRVPMVTVYEGRYNAAITAQLLSACRTVIDHPRH